MKVLSRPIIFEWDLGNLDKNFLKHQVTNQEAEEVFSNKPNLILEDKKHSQAEKRYMIWGITKKGRKLAVIFTLRTDKIRVISARDMHDKERRSYEEKTQTNP